MLAHVRGLVVVLDSQDTFASLVGRILIAVVVLVQTAILAWRFRNNQEPIPIRSAVRSSDRLDECC
jgi:hypothetical protein